jgi:predicted P-loop ATPase
MSNRDAALALAAAKFRVFCLLPRKKIPALQKWNELATTHLDQVKALFPEVDDGMLTAESNIGIATGNGLFVLDLDPRHGSAASIADLQVEHGKLPMTRTVRTPSGGQHLYFKVPAGQVVRNSSGKVGAGLDIRGDGGYVVAPPSVTDAGSYELEVDAPISETPPWLLEAALAAKPCAAGKASEQPVETLTTVSDADMITLRSAMFHDKFRQSCAANGSWAEAGYSLLSLGKLGGQLFCEWSRETPGYEPGAPEQWWSKHADQTPRADWRHILKMARACGWNPPVAATETFPIVQADQWPPIVPASGELQRSGRGATISNTHNAVVMLQGQQNVSFHYDEFSDKMMVQWPGEEPKQLGDHDVIRAQIALQGHGLTSLSKESARDAINVVARKDVRNCVTGYLNNLEHDGIPRLTRLLVESLGVEQNRMHAHAGRNLMIAAVARAFYPGCKVDEMPVLEGPQGAKKNQWWETLGGSYYAELTADSRSKDFEQQLRGVWFAQFAELSVLNRGDIERLKQFVTCRVDHYRPSYGREVRDYPRRCVFGATTNSNEWLHDPTGGRRFIPIEVVKIDIEWLRKNRDQLFAEAVVLFKRGYKWWYYPKAQTLAAQQERMPDDPWLDPIRDYLYGRHHIVDIGEVLEHALKMPPDRQTKVHSTRVGQSLKNLGCVRQPQRRIDGERRRPWSVPEQYASKPCRRSGPVPTGAAAFDPVPTVTGAAAGCDGINEAGNR